MLARLVEVDDDLSAERGFEPRGRMLEDRTVGPETQMRQSIERCVIEQTGADDPGHGAAGGACRPAQIC